MNNVLIVVFVIFSGIICLSVFGVIKALQCPMCRKHRSMVWQDVHQRSICKHCGWFVYAKEWEPPKHTVLNLMKKHIDLVMRISQKASKKKEKK